VTTVPISGRGGGTNTHSEQYVRGSGAEEARMRDSQGGESDPAEGVRRRCMKNSLFFYPE